MSSEIELERPFVTATVPRIGGRIKQEPADFEVVEVPLYEASGEGAHLYLQIRREGRNTRDLVERLAALGDIPARDVGYAGLKDRHAVTTQTFSLPVDEEASASVIDAIQADEELELLTASRHGNKLKRGHLLGNRFRIRLREVEEGAAERAGAVLEVLRRRGMPNYFGPQRYGRDGRNAEKGAAILAGRRERDRFLRELCLHAWQSRFFDDWLAMRIEEGSWDSVLLGDVARVEGRGGLFTVEDEVVEKERAARGEISAMGPMFGAKTMPVSGPAAEIEARLEGSQVPRETFRKLRLQGSRRAARVFPKELSCAVQGGDLVLTFELPKGSYATSLLRELTKTEIA